MPLSHPNRRDFLALLTSESVKTVFLIVAGGGAGAVVSRVQLEGMATLESRQRAREMIAAGLEMEEEDLTRIIEREYESNTNDMSILGTVAGAFCGTLISMRSGKQTEEREPDFY